MNRFVWDLTYPGPETVDGGGSSGPRGVPGMYQVRLSAGGSSQTQSFEVLKDPRISTTLAQFRRQFDLLIDIRDKITAIQDAIRVIRSVTEQANALAMRLAALDADGRIGESAEMLNDKLAVFEGKLLQRRQGFEPNPTLAGDFDWLATIVSSADAQPTDQSYEVFTDLSDALAAELNDLDGVLETDLAAFNGLVEARGVPAVIVPPRGRRVVVSSGSR